MDINSILLGVILTLISIILLEVIYISIIKKKDADEIIKEIEWKSKDETKSLSDDELHDAIKRDLDS